MLNRRRFLLGTVAAVVIPAVAEAQEVVICPTCTQLWQQLISWAQQLKAYILQVQQYQVEFGTYLQAIISGLTLPGQIYSSIVGDINVIRSIIRQSDILAGSSGSLLTKLSEMGALGNTAAFLPQAMVGQVTMWNTTLQNSYTKLGHVLDQQQANQATETANQERATLQATTAVGQMQAISATNVALANTNYTLNQIQQTLTASAQAQVAKDMTDRSRQQLADQQFFTFMQPPPFATTGWPNY